MDDLAEYLYNNLIIDFERIITWSQCKEFLREEKSQAALDLKAKFIRDKGVEKFLIFLSDHLKERLPKGINEKGVKESMAQYINT